MPEQKSPQTPVEWQAIRLSGADALAVRASKKLRSEELLVTSLGSTILRKYLDEIPLWRSDHTEVRQLVEDFARYPYLPRLTGPEILLRSIRDGVALLTWQTDTFALAESVDEVAGRYRGLRGGKVVTLAPESRDLVVKPNVARRQMEAETAASSTSPVAESTSTSDTGPVNSPASSTGPTTQAATEPRVVQVLPKRFHGAVSLDPARAGRDAARIAEEIISHLAGQPGAILTVTLEIEATLPNGAPDQLVRTVTENSRTLKFGSHGFEKE